MPRINDARNRQNSAGERLKKGDYAGAIREAQASIELSAKALLDKLQIDYTIMRGKRKEIPHDVSDKIPEAFEKLKPYLEDYDVEPKKIEMARVMVLLKLLTSIKNFAEFGVEDLKVSAQEVFYFDKELASVLINLTGILNWRIFDVIQKIDASRSKGQ